jgi:hypothetical protein
MDDDGKKIVLHHNKKLRGAKRRKETRGKKLRFFFGILRKIHVVLFKFCNKKKKNRSNWAGI